MSSVNLEDIDKLEKFASNKVGLEKVARSFDEPLTVESVLLVLNELKGSIDIDMNQINDFFKKSYKNESKK